MSLLPGLLSALLLLSPSMPEPSTPPDSTDNPLPACPDSPNCERTSRPYATSADRLFEAAQEALTSLGPTALEVAPETHRCQAVYRVALVFKDDVDVAVTGDDEAATVHIRSASRVGYSDLGVNDRRVRRFFRALDEALAAAQP